ncbi:MAG: hypothetical protein MUF27_09640 [Acidobacteria bacterium]|jgi:hypothetical protein|nr:hypothetical protein [Acidobacteriota bacterium]
MRLSGTGKGVLIAAAIALAGTAVQAVETEVWVRDGKTLRGGTFEGMALDPSGALVAGPAATTLGRPEAPVLWDALLSGDEALAGSGESMGLWRLAAGTDPQRLPGLPADPDVFALARGAKGEVYLATGPKGAVYRFDRAKGLFEELARPDAAYLWDLVVLPGGDLAVATGMPGRVLRIAPGTRQVSTLWETREPHVRRLALAPDGTLYAGTAGSGLLVRLDGKGGGFVVWDSDRPEVAAIAAGADGRLWAAFAGPTGRAEAGGTGERARKSEGGEAPATTITVRARAAAEEEGAKPKEPAAGETPRAPEVPAGGGELVLIAAGRAPRPLWSDGKETPLALLARPSGGVLMGTAGPARIWWFDGAGGEGWWAELPENGAVTALDGDGERVLAAASNPAAVVLYGPGRAASARWTSDVLDARRSARFGRIAVVAGDAPVRVLARSGNTAEPGPGWSEWTEVKGAAGAPGAAGVAAGVPDARFLQVRLEAAAGASAAGPAAPLATRVEARYQAANRAPRVDDVDVLPQGVALRAMPPSAVAAGDAPVVPPPRGVDAQRALGDGGGAARSKKAWESEALTVTWQAKDPDEDALTYRLEYCAEGTAPCGAWAVLAEELEQAFFSFDARRLADGIYRFRVTASDAPDNVAGAELTGELISDAVRIDHTAPVVDAVETTRLPGGQLGLRIAARDPGGRLAGCEVAAAPGEGRMLGAADGVIDGDAETFEGAVDAPAEGRALVVTVVDAAGNETTARVPKAEPARR